MLAQGAHDLRDLLVGGMAVPSGFEIADRGRGDVGFERQLLLGQMNGTARFTKRRDSRTMPNRVQQFSQRFPIGVWL